MAVCDICNSHGVGTVISAENMRQAVFKNGFNPLSLGLVRDPMAQMNKGEWYQGWKNTIVAQDTSDWNICPNCMASLKSYLKGTPKPTGVRKAQVSADPVVSTLAGAATEQKYKKGKNERMWGCLLSTSGLLILAVGLCIVASMVTLLIDPARVENNPVNVLIVMAICVLPFVITGPVLLRFGISKLRSDRKQPVAAPTDTGLDGAALEDPPELIQGTDYLEGDRVK